MSGSATLYLAVLGLAGVLQLPVTHATCRVDMDSLSFLTYPVLQQMSGVWYEHRWGSIVVATIDPFHDYSLEFKATSSQVSEVIKRYRGSAGACGAARGNWTSHSRDTPGVYRYQLWTQEGTTLTKDEDALVRVLQLDADTLTLFDCRVKASGVCIDSEVSVSLFTRSKDPISQEASDAFKDHVSKLCIQSDWIFETQHNPPGCEGQAALTTRDFSIVTSLPPLISSAPILRQPALVAGLAMLVSDLLLF